MRLDAAIAAATERLRTVSDSPRLDAEILLCRTINMPRSYLFAHPEDELDEASLQRLDDTVMRRVNGEPMAYITGVKEFWSLELLVTPATLVPRPETEILVERALTEMPRRAYDAETVRAPTGRKHGGTKGQGRNKGRGDKKSRRRQGRRRK